MKHIDEIMKYTAFLVIFGEAFALLCVMAAGHMTVPMILYTQLPILLFAVIPGVMLYVRFRH